MISALETTLDWPTRLPDRAPMIGMALAKSIYAGPTWTRTVALISEHASLRAVITDDAQKPSAYACDRFTTKLRAYSDMLDACLDRVTKGLHAANPRMGTNVAIDRADMP